jgi:hypothetical protein
MPRLGDDLPDEGRGRVDLDLPAECIGNHPPDDTTNMQLLVAVLGMLCNYWLHI